MLWIDVLHSSCCFFFFKQKTAYEMRISDWSSDVCSSDLHFVAHALELGFRALLDLRARQRRVERELQLLVVQLRADAEVALRIRHQGVVEPFLLPGHGLAQRADGVVELLAVVAFGLAGVGRDALVAKRHPDGPGRAS